jgi:hypothetical protein
MACVGLNLSVSRLLPEGEGAQDSTAPVPTQEVAAQRLGLPLSTYRRRLSRALREICDQLWSRELYGWATD